MRFKNTPIATMLKKLHDFSDFVISISLKSIDIPAEASAIVEEGDRVRLRRALAGPLVARIFSFFGIVFTMTSIVRLP